MHFAPEPLAFPSRLERLLRISVFGSESVDEAKARGLGEKVKRLWPTLSKNRGLAETGRHYSFDPGLAEAYAAYYLPANALKFPLILREMECAGLPLPSDLKIADFGAGPGTTLWGAALTGKPILYRALEQSPAFAAQGRRMAAHLKELTPVDARWIEGDPARFARGEDFNLFVFQNSVHEIFPDSKNRLDALLRITREAARRGGTRWLVLIEPALRASSRDLLMLRRELLKAEHLRLWLPCLDSRECGALKEPDDWCHEEVAVDMPSWVNAVGSWAGLRKESMLFSYLVFSVGAHPQVAEWPEQGLRMVSQRLERKGYTECRLCTGAGKIRCRVQHSKITDENRGALKWSRGQLLRNVEVADNTDVIRYRLFETTTVQEWDKNGLLPS